MMKGLNNKGISTAEVLVCFVLVVLVSSSIYSIVSTFKSKQQIESFKEKVVTYKNLLTREINDDLIKKGLVAVFDDGSGTVTMNLRNGETKCLVIEKKDSCNDFLDNSDYQNTNAVGCAADNDEKFRVGYGDCGSVTYYSFPNLGDSYNKNGMRILDLRIADYAVNTSNQVFSVNIRFYHPELGYKYGIDIVSPIDFSL